MRAVTFLTLMLAFLFSALPARAHNPLQSWISVVTLPDSLELVITTAPINALRLLNPDAAGPLTRAQFPALKPKLLELAPKLCVVAGEIPSRIDRADVALTEENDVTFTLHLVPGPAHTLRVDAVFLRQLGEDFTSMIVVANAKGDDLGWDQLTAENPRFELTLPPPAKPKT